MNDIKSGKVDAKLRRTDDIEVLVDSIGYKLRIIVSKIQDPLKQFATQLKRIKNIPNRLRKVLLKNKIG